IKVYRERNVGIFTIFGQAYEVVFNNSMVIKPNSNVMINIDRFGRAQVFEQRIGGRQFDLNDRDWRQDQDFDFDRGRNYGDYGERERNLNKRVHRVGDMDTRNGS